MPQENILGADTAPAGGRMRFAHVIDLVTTASHSEIYNLV